MKVTHLAHETHIETVEEGNDGKRAYFWLVRHNIYENPIAGTDIHTVAEQKISISNLHTLLNPHKIRGITDTECTTIFNELKSGETTKVK